MRDRQRAKQGDNLIMTKRIGCKKVKCDRCDNYFVRNSRQDRICYPCWKKAHKDRRERMIKNIDQLKEANLKSRLTMKGIMDFGKNQRDVNRLLKC